jgi:hypothetical protein
MSHSIAYWCETNHGLDSYLTGALWALVVTECMVLIKQIRKHILKYTSSVWLINNPKPQSEPIQYYYRYTRPPVRSYKPMVLQ